MKYRNLFVSTLLAMTAGAKPASAVTFGAPDGGAHPAVGAVMLQFSDDNISPPVCSGTLIHSKVFLTAGHCTSFFQFLLDIGAVSEVRVSFDEEPDPADFAAFHKVVTVMTHPDYPGPGGSFNADAHDIGLLILESDVTGIAPVALPSPGFLDDLRANRELRRSQFTVVGYGALLQWPPPTYLPGGTRQVAQSEFRNLRKPWLQMSQVHAPGTNDGGTCFGDSGGPTFWTDPIDGAEVLVAVTSWGDVNCVATGVAYRVDIDSSLQFIQDAIADLN